MAGHSHWAKVKHQKGLSDIRKGKLFSKLSREISIAARIGGGDPAFNSRLRRAIATARDEGVPQENIIRAIQKGTGEISGSHYEEVLYEGYGPGGIAILVEAATDNRNRTTSEIRNLFSKYGGNLGAAGSVSWLFQRRGKILIEKDKCDFDKVFEVAVEAEAEEVQQKEGEIEVIAFPEKLDELLKCLEKAGIVVKSSQIVYLPKNSILLSDKETAKSLFRLLEVLEDQDDVQNVYANFDVPQEFLELN
ncbi:YebC/PmpR family DNA-binding transcriptional regulator [Candidatus Methylacidiphilum fumarolicum]|uniref:Probable transcriptional regulatory protein MFUM_880009 n=2 Tax=Candidatus Methylacidiphilum fumarolicum TaxID=591154 RepID=I0K0H3_METFB|nr:YebC/PmpR family DNA-binding transcriptional regulator [Candidatus Methylacidiphilum fumarolicum]MBW6414577.1 YebC/PmpR family DNA-binding transcriptional regulator [Candidatus Methylacidiphilum fumarolicum]TFE65557.1 transcriptional regulator [Candidatus Methylacidiphilum fumarolicum]TFE72646.1 YebC/PmpR family DNA-binding transcriptional regulator [Candidatus Methylacidiphilum fumarolicum]TFE75173.1 YebC/PmpR family DNA-binding transcriptional regulator [Candidatus Methylacidiphilum fumaro